MIGFLFRYDWMIYLFAWGGALYDLIIPFLLLNRKTRGLGFTMVVFFHLLTAILFPIGMFPYLMIFSALIFFNFQFHKKTIDGLRQILNIKNRKIHLIQDTSFRHSLINRVKIGILVLTQETLTFDSKTYLFDTEWFLGIFYDNIPVKKWKRKFY